MKYEIGDFVSKPFIGICKIENILYLNPQREKTDKLYYLMKPIEDEKEKIYVPVSNSDSRLRSCLTEKEAWDLIKRIPEIPTAWTNNEKIHRLYKVNEQEAVKMMTDTDKRRMTNYNFYTDQKWGRASNYMLCLNSSQIGYENCEKIIMECMELELR